MRGVFAKQRRNRAIITNFHGSASAGSASTLTCLCAHLDAPVRGAAGRGSCASMVQSHVLIFC